MLERLFQTQLQREFIARGWITKHLSPPSEPGFPDLVLWRCRESMLIELKITPSFGTKKSFGSLFTNAQLPWAIRWLGQEGMPYPVVLSDAEGNYGSIWLYSDEQVYRLKDMEVRSVPFTFTNSLGTLVSGLLADADKQGDFYP